jgi:hypothetical protein
VCPAAGDAGRYHLSDFDHREACAAYIDSQRHEGWLALDDHYDDGGYSVGTLERLALQRLIRDIEAPAEGRIYRYYVTREAIADGYVTCPVTSVPAADVEGAVLDHIQKLLAAPELVARTWAAAKREGENEITEREVTILLAELATVWNELFPAEQARIVQLLVERVDVQEDASKCGSEPRASRASLQNLRQPDERRAA